MQRQFSRLQLHVMHVLWKLRNATVAEVQEAVGSERPLAYSTLATVLARLEAKDAVKHRRDGRTFVYSPAITEEEASHSMVHDLVDRMFRGSPAELVSHLLDRDDVNAKELTLIKELIARYEAARRKGKRGGRRGR